jgi:hypothetical protein
VNEWISVKDRLPDEGLRVLIYAKDGSRKGCATAYQLDGVWWGWIWRDQTEPHIDLNDECFEVPHVPTRYITHWMPLPEPPDPEVDEANKLINRMHQDMLNSLAAVIICETCIKLTDYCLKNNPEWKGFAMCKRCIEESGIVPFILQYNPYKLSEPPK